MPVRGGYSPRESWGLACRLISSLSSVLMLGALQQAVIARSFLPEALVTAAVEVPPSSIFVHTKTSPLSNVEVLDLAFESCLNYVLVCLNYVSVCVVGANLIVSRKNRRENSGRQSGHRPVYNSRCTTRGWFLRVTMSLSRRGFAPASRRLLVPQTIVHVATWFGLTGVAGPCDFVNWFRSWLQVRSRFGAGFSDQPFVPCHASVVVLESGRSGTSSVVVPPQPRFLY